MSVEADLAALQARVAALEAQEVGGDTITPTYLTIDAQGRVTANFSGHVKASGVDLPEGGSIFQATSALDWLDAAGTVQEWIQGGAQGSAPVLRALRLLAGATNPNTAQLVLNSASNGNASVQAVAAAITRIIIGEVGESHFLQLPTAQQLAIDSGSAGPSTGGNLTTNHNLGRQPVAVVGLQNTGSIAFNSATPTTITFNCSAAGISISWIALG